MQCFDPSTTDATFALVTSVAAVSLLLALLRLTCLTSTTPLSTKVGHSALSLRLLLQAMETNRRLPGVRPRSRALKNLSLGLSTSVSCEAVAAYAQDGVRASIGRVVTKVDGPLTDGMNKRLSA